MHGIGHERTNTRRGGLFLSRVRVFAAVFWVVVASGLLAAARDPFTLDRAAERWVEQTMKKLTVDEKVGQLIVPSFESNFLSTDSDDVRDADAPRPRVSRRRLSRVRRVDARPVRAVEPRLRDRHSRPAVFGGVPDQPPAGALDGAAAEHRRLRDRRRLPHLRRDPVSPADGDGRDRARRRRT